MTHETTPPGEERGGEPRVIYRWPGRTAPPGPARNLARVLDDVTGYIRRYVVLSDPQAVACTLWVAHCHAFAAAEATPYLNVTSAVKQSGKTRLLEVLEPLVPSPWLTGRVSAAVLTRKVDGETPTLLLDESDAAFSHRSEYAEALRSILNSGYRRSGSSSLCVAQGTGLDGVRGKYCERCKEGTNVVLLEPDLANVFRDSATVTEALRQYLTEHGTPPAAHKPTG